MFLGFRDGIAWRHLLDCQATLAAQPNFGFFWMKGQAGLIEPLGDAGLWLDSSYSGRFG